MSIEYHVAELGIALNPDHPAHIAPPPRPTQDRVLDIGCGAGQTLVAAYPDRTTFGIDIDPDALQFGKTHTKGIRFTCGRAEALPYADKQFDMVIARVSLAYTDMGASLKEIRRVLRDGGQVWMVLHPFSIPWKQAKSSNWKGWIFFSYIVINSLLFELTQKHFPFRGRYESFQTARGISRALTKAGFKAIAIQHGKGFVVTAEAGS